jgi:hypothetical protein
VTLADARQTEQTRRAQAALGQGIPKPWPTSDVTLRAFLDDTYVAWMKSAYAMSHGPRNSCRFDPPFATCSI